MRLYESGKQVSVISSEYEICTLTIYKWINESKTTGSFKASDNLTDEQRDLKASSEQKAENILDRSYDDRVLHEVGVSDLTYVNVKGNWHYICILIDLFNREIIGHSCGSNKDSTLVKLKSFILTEVENLITK